MPQPRRQTRWVAVGVDGDKRAARVPNDTIERRVLAGTELDYDRTGAVPCRDQTQACCGLPFTLIPSTGLVASAASLSSTHLRFTYLTTRPEAVARRSVSVGGRTGLQIPEASDARSPLARAKHVEKSSWVYTYRNSFVHVLDEDTASLD